jgi:hypothetical protein
MNEAPDAEREPAGYPALTLRSDVMAPATRLR